MSVIVFGNYTSIMCNRIICMSDGVCVGPCTRLCLWLKSLGLWNKTKLHSANTKFHHLPTVMEFYLSIDFSYEISGLFLKGFPVYWPENRDIYQKTCTARPSGDLLLHQFTVENFGKAVLPFKNHQSRILLISSCLHQTKQKCPEKLMPGLWRMEGMGQNGG